MKMILLLALTFVPLLVYSQFTMPYPDLSYDAFLCEEELFKDQIVCMNKRLELEGLGPHNEPIYYSQDCEYSSISLPPYIDLPGSLLDPYECSGVCCNGGLVILDYDNPLNRTSFYNIDLVCTNNPNGVAITKVDENCWNLKYLDTGSFLFSLNIKVRPGREIEGSYGNCEDTTYYYTCGLDRVWKQFTVDVGNQYACNNYVENPCNLIQNGGFEEMYNCPMDFYSPYYDQTKHINFANLMVWEEIVQFKEPFFRSTCKDYFGTYPYFPSEPIPSGDNFLEFESSINSSFTGQFLDLCQGQKYRFGFFALKRNGQNPPPYIALSGVNTTDFSSNPTFTNLTSYTLTTQSQNWEEYSKEFISSGDFNGIRIDGMRFYLDDISIVPLDTLALITESFSSDCDSAELRMQIPGCYGPYEVELLINGQNLIFSNISDGDLIHVPLPASTLYEVVSITNSMNCITLLNSIDTIQAPGNAAFSSTDICFGSTNSITFLGNQGVFSLVNDVTNAQINSETGILTNVVGNQAYIIQHQYCTSVFFDTIFVFQNNASFFSSNICVGSVNEISQLITNGGFSLLYPDLSATIDPISGVIINAVLGNDYTIQHVVGSTCADTVVQTITVHEMDDATFSTSNFCVNSVNAIQIIGDVGGFFRLLPPIAGVAFVDSSAGFISNATVNQSYILEYVTNGECKDSSTQTVFVLPLPTASIFGVSGDLCVNDSLPIQFLLTGIGPWDLTYSNGNSSYVLNGVSNSPLTVYVDNIGDYSAALVTDSQCSNVGDSAAIVKITGDSILISSSNVNGCAPTEVVFSTNISGQDFDCIWKFGDGTILGECDSVVHTYTQSGFYSVEFAVSSPRCVFDTILINYIQIYEDPVAIFNLNPTNPTIANNRVETSNLSVDNVQNRWYLNDNLYGIETDLFMDLPGIVQNNEVCLVVFNQHGCVDTSCVNIYVNSASLMYLPNSFIPDGDGLNDVFLPVASNLRFFELQIFNRWGTVIFETKDVNNGWDGTYHGEMVSSGVYTYRLVYRFWGNQENEIVNGHLTLIR